MKTIQINPSDNVVVAVEPIEAGETFEHNGHMVAACSSVPFGHKLACIPISEGSSIIKYGSPIGIATANIQPGEHVHTNNMKTGLSGQLQYNYTPALTDTKAIEPGTFRGYMREDGRAGIRNEIWILPTVGCVNAIGEEIARRTQALVHGSVDGVYCFPHPYGCSQLGEDHENTKKALCALAHHPNAGGVLILGLGCENNHIAGMQACLGHGETDRVKFLTCQQSDDEVADGLALVSALIDTAAADCRTDVVTDQLVIGLKCGGSDGLSGITANPLVGALSDRVISEGGSAILTEVPEMFGAEHLLMARCESQQVFDKAVSLINDFKAYFESYGQPVYENPSPGNKAGGITTLEDKALGCTQKAGGANVVDVLGYAQPLTKRGLNLLQAPGNDLVASTALALSGAQIILFTTGRGTPFGAPVPTVKLSSNAALYEKKKNWIDFDASPLLTGTSMETLCNDLYAYVLRLAGGELQTHAEAVGARDLAIFKSGVTL